MRTGTRRGLVLVPLAGLGAAALVRLLRGAPSPAFQSPPQGMPRLRTVDPTTPDVVAPAPPATPDAVSEPLPKPVEPPPSDPRKGWVAPVDGTCPADYPVKVKLRSGIFHQPGMLAYERTIPDRCYPTVDAAAADGFRPAKR